MSTRPSQTLKLPEMLSDPIDFRVYLSDAEFRARVLQYRAWADFLTQPPIPPFDEPDALAAIAQRNAVRAESNLPLLDAMKEVPRLKQAYESERLSERFYDVSYRCIEEIYGEIKPSDFSGMSGMAAFFASRRNVIRDLLIRRGIHQLLNRFTDEALDGPFRVEHLW